MRTGKEFKAAPENFLVGPGLTCYTSGIRCSTEENGASPEGFPGPVQGFFALFSVFMFAGALEFAGGCMDRCIISLKCLRESVKITIE